MVSKIKKKNIYSKKIWIIMNISLFLIAIILMLRFYSVELPTLGHAEYMLDFKDPICMINLNSQYNSLEDLDMCCFEASKQLECNEEQLFIKDFELNHVCSTGSNVIKYWLNNKAYKYCKIQPYWQK